MNELQTRVCDLAQKRVPPRQIASILNVNVDKVYSAIRALRTAGVDIPEFSKSSPKREVGPEAPKPLVIGLRLHRLLQYAAEKRGVSPNDLARDLIETALLRKAAQDG
ncbi:hypothetical protein [Marivita sp.]|uniref:hypothetical protein n=1 Tax=Marivita sp. TaxID=2003365 RepID=UPI003F70A0FF